MRRGLVALVLLGLGGCTTPPPPKVEYLPPTSSPTAINRSVVRLPADMAWNQVLDRLQQSDLKIDYTDPGAGVMVATYKGEPASFVDCGWIVKHTAEDLERVPASAPKASFDRIINKRRLRLERDLRLDGRMVLRFQPQGRETLVTADSTYVLTKLIELKDGGGAPRGGTYEIVSFRTGERGEFNKGTVCQSTGQFELAALEALPVVVGGNGFGDDGAGNRSTRATVTEVPTTDAPDLSEPVVPASLDCTGDEWSFCDVLDSTRTYRDANREQNLGLAVATVNEGGATLVEGQSLALDIRLPVFDAYVHVAYLQRDGTVGHVVPGSSQRWPADGRRYVQDTAYEIAPPFGREMILAVATSEPLFQEPRPRFEPALDYIDDLRRRLGELRARNPAGRIAVSHRFVTTGPRPATIAGSPRVE